MSSIAAGLGQLSGWVACLVVGALVFGETAVFLGFVLPGETAVVIGGVLASHGHVSLAALMAVVVVTASVGPLAGYEIGRRMGDRVFTSRALRRVPGGPERARLALRDRGALAVLLGRFVAVLRALMPAAAGAVGVRYRTFVIYDVAGAVIWGVGWCLVGYLAGSAYSAVESRVGSGLAIAVAAVVVAALVVWLVRRRRRAVAAGLLGEDPSPGGAGPGAGEPGGASARESGGVPADRRGD